MIKNQLRGETIKKRPVGSAVNTGDKLIRSQSNKTRVKLVCPRVTILSQKNPREQADTFFNIK